MSRPVLIEGAERFVSDHAAEQYLERVKPHLTAEEARSDVERMLALGGARSSRPTWALVAAETDEWVTLGEGIAFPVRGQTLMTCVTRAAPSDGERDRRAEERRRQDADGFSPKRRKQHGKVQRGERARARRRQELRGG